MRKSAKTRTSTAQDDRHSRERALSIRHDQQAGDDAVDVSVCLRPRYVPGSSVTTTPTKRQRDNEGAMGDAVVRVQKHLQELSRDNFSALETSHGENIEWLRGELENLCKEIDVAFKLELKRPAPATSYTR